MIPSASPSLWEMKYHPLTMHPSLSQYLWPHHLGAAWPRCAGKREGATPAAAEHSGQMWKVHFATASHAEAAELEACTYPAATWHGKKGHSSLRNSLHTWRHPLVIRREATGRVFPAPPPPLHRPGWPQEGRWEPGREWGACGMLPLPSDPRLCVALSLPACCEGRSHPGLDSADSAFWAEPGCH